MPLDLPRATAAAEARSPFHTSTAKDALAMMTDPPIQMVALRPLRYGGKQLAKGQGFTVRHRADARILHAARLAAPEQLVQQAAVVAPTAPPAPTPIEQIAALEPAPPIDAAENMHSEAIEPEPVSEPESEPTAETSDEPEKAPARRRYRRRDLTAEG
jgi:hypothetical protein